MLLDFANTKALYLGHARAHDKFRVAFLVVNVCGTLLWNNYYKKLLTPSEAELHRDYTTTFDLTACKFVFSDFSTKVGSFKSRLKHLLFDLQYNALVMKCHGTLN